MNLKNLTYEEAAKACADYPAFAPAILAAYRLAPDDALRSKYRAMLAANVGDTTALRHLLGIDSESLVDFYPDTLLPTLSTDDTIESFLDRFGDNSAGDQDPLTPQPATDYLSQLEALPPADPDDFSEQSDHADSHDDTDDAISNFLQAVPPPKPAECAPLTESFARILIKNHNYAKALDIITELNLKNPEKSIYFADQIRFLKKLIKIQEKNK